MNWYYRKNETNVGPIEMDTLLSQIDGDTFVWKQNSEITDWVKAKEHKDLLFAFNNSNSPALPEITIIQATETTPAFEFDRTKGALTLRGKSTSKDAFQFYQQIFELLAEYAKQPAAHTTLNIQLDLFNSASARCLIDLFKTAEIISNSKQTVTIKWYYDKGDKDMLETGKDFSDMGNLPFKMVETSAGQHLR